MAIEALAFLAAEPVELKRFLSLTGLEAHELRRAVEGPGFLPAVLDYLLGNERSLLAFCEASGAAPGSVAQARAALAPMSTPR